LKTSVDNKETEKKVSIYALQKFSFYKIFFLKKQFDLILNKRIKELEQQIEEKTKLLEHKQELEKKIKLMKKELNFNK
jgi:hypothetical protein